MQTETITALQLFEQGLTKGAINNMVCDAVEHVLETGNPLVVAEAVAAMKEFCKGVENDDRFNDYVREEALKNPKGVFVSSSGAKIEACETGTAYKFDNCADSELAELEQQSLSAKSAVDARKAFLRTVPTKGMDVRYRDELITVYPPAKTSNSSFKITLAK